MMLQALYQLAQREGLLDDPDFEKKRVDYLLRIDKQGRFVSLESTHDEKGRAKEYPVPRFPKRAYGIKPGFLYDNAKYVLGIGGEDPTRMKDCVKAFVAEVEKARSTNDPGVLAVCQFFEKHAVQVAAIQKDNPNLEWTGSEWLAFLLDGDEPTLVHQRSSVRDYWRTLRSNVVGEGNQRCLVTGSFTKPQPTHPSVKPVPGAKTTGAALVSFDKPSFCSHGLIQGQNAPISRAAAEGYVTALNWLLEGTPERRHRYGVPLGDEAVMLFWTRNRDPSADLFASLFDPRAESAMALAESVRKGLEPTPADDLNAFYAVTLSGNAARVVVRDWLETTVAVLKRNVRRYFDDLTIGNRRGTPTPLRALLEALEPPGRSGLSPDLATRMLGAALRGRPFPREVLSTALRRIRLPPRSGEGSQDFNARTVRLCALIKATLLRLPRSGPPIQEVKVSLDDTNRQVPYVLGRLFAVLERLQRAALGDVNASIRDRYFGAAMAHPATVFPRLLALANHHAAKAEARWLEAIQGQVMALLPAQRFPASLTLEDQGLFAVGYFHQREKFFEKRSESLPAQD